MYCEETWCVWSYVLKQTSDFSHQPVFLSSMTGVVIEMLDDTSRIWFQFCRQFAVGFEVIAENVTNTPGAFKKKTSGDFRYSSRVGAACVQNVLLVLFRYAGTFVGAKCVCLLWVISNVATLMCRPKYQLALSVPSEGHPPRVPFWKRVLDKRMRNWWSSQSESGAFVYNSGFSTLHHDALHDSWWVHYPNDVCSEET